MFISVGTNYLDVDAADSDIPGYLFPLAASQFKRVARVRDYAASDTKIVAGYPLCEAVALSLDVGRK
jgi:hypothetical protein